MKLLKDTDSYKLSHPQQYPPYTQYNEYYLSARSGSCVFFGLYPLLKKLVCPTINDVEEAQNYWEEQGLELPRKWMDIPKLGYLPLAISAVLEGTRVPQGNVLMKVINTHPDFFWLPGWVETALLRVWYPSTVATISNDLKKVLEEFHELSGVEDTLQFKLHDFGSRGASSSNTAAIGGASHLISFTGTDTGLALGFVKKHYSPTPNSLIAASIPAAEHSTITTWGEDGEARAYKNMLDTFGNGLVAVVSDSYDLENALNIWGSMKENIQKMKGTLIIRPDSGDPIETPIRCLQRLSELFGSQKNEKGYYTLNNVRVIQGDGINPQSIEEIISRMKMGRWSIDNIAFGMGGALLQNCNRDTLGFTYKCSATCRGGEWHDVYKLAPGKKSLRGRLALIKTDQEFETIRLDDLAGRDNLLYPVFNDGMLVNTPSWNMIKLRANDKS